VEDRARAGQASGAYSKRRTRPRSNPWANQTIRPPCRRS